MADLEWQLQGQGNGRGRAGGNGGNAKGGGRGGGIANPKARANAGAQPKGVGKGNPQSTKWLCMCCDCHRSAAGEKNNGSRTHCLFCGRAKAVCKDPPASIGCRDGTRYVQTPAKADDEAEEQRLQRNANRKAKKQERIRQKKEARTPAAPADNAGQKDQQMIVDDAGDKKEVKLLVLPRMPCMRDYLATRTKPPESESIKSADQCLLHVAPKDRAEELARARADVTYLESSLTEANKGAVGSLQLAAASGLKAKLAEAKATAETLAGNAPASATTITLMEKTISHHKHSSTERMEAWKVAAEKRTTNKDNALKLIDDHLLALQKYRLEVVEDYDSRQVAWESHNSKVSGVMSKVAAALQERLDAARLELGVVAEPGEEKKESASPAAIPAAEVAAPTLAEQDYYRIAQWSPSELPQIPEAKPGEHEFWLRLAYNVQEWSHTHGCQPCTYGELLTSGLDPSTDTAETLSKRMESLAGLVGLAYWVKMYGERVVVSTDVVPHQLGFVLYQAMTIPRETAEKAIGDKKAKEELKLAKASIKEAMANMKARPKVGKFVKHSVTK